MTTELWILVFVGMLAFLLAILSGLAKVINFNLLTMENYPRDDLPALSGWGGRAERSLQNLFESLPLFTILILAAHVTGANNDMTLFGAELFFVGRVLHPVFYIFGPYGLRTLAWAVATTGMVMIGLQLA